MYAILDIETTGGKFNEEGITEIAIYKYDGHQILDKFISLINPEREIQEFVVKLTGINNKMLRNAPKFYEVAKRILEITENCIIVAHNTTFDYRILRTEFDRLGYQFLRDTLCTVELSKQLLVDMPSYSLGKLTKSLGIPITDRHRANGDALATVHLFKLLMDKDSEKKIIQRTINHHHFSKKKDKQQALLDSLPKSMGIYYVHNALGNVIFIGKGKNIQKEVNKLFLKTSKRALNIQEKVATISSFICGNGLFMNLRYYLELETISPKFNTRKKFKHTANTFNNDGFMLTEKGRVPEEKALVLIQENEVTHYGYISLNYQQHSIDMLTSVLTPISHKEIAKTIVLNYLKCNTSKKNIHLEIL